MLQCLNIVVYCNAVAHVGMCLQIYVCLCEFGVFVFGGCIYFSFWSNAERFQLIWWLQKVKQALLVAARYLMILISKYAILI